MYVNICVCLRGVCVCVCLQRLSEKHDKVQLVFLAVNFSCCMECFWSINKIMKKVCLVDISQLKGVENLCIITPVFSRPCYLSRTLAEATFPSACVTVVHTHLTHDAVLYIA